MVGKLSVESSGKCGLRKVARDSNRLDLRRGEELAGLKTDTDKRIDREKQREGEGKRGEEKKGS